MPQTRHVSIPARFNAHIELVIEDFGGFSRFVHQALEAYANARLHANAENPEGTDFAIQILQARIAASSEAEKAAKVSRAVDEKRLMKLAEIQAAKEAARAAASYRSPEDLVEAVWARARELGGEDRQALWRHLADEHGFDVRAIKRAAGRKHTAERAGQTNLRALPKIPKSPRVSFGKASMPEHEVSS